jgi:hypothetical protein
MLIKINRSSIKPNPNAGNSTYYQALGNGEYEILHTISPEGKWLYEYEDTLVTCYHCKAQFSYNDLESDEMSFGDNDMWTDKVCPKCHTWSCCEIEFERIEQVCQ